MWVGLLRLQGGRDVGIRNQTHHSSWLDLGAWAGVWELQLEMNTLETARGVQVRCDWSSVGSSGEQPSQGGSSCRLFWQGHAKWLGKGGWANVSVGSWDTLTSFVRQSQRSCGGRSFDALGCKWTGSESSECLGERETSRKVVGEELRTSFFFFFQRQGDTDHFYFHVDSWGKTLLLLGPRRMVLLSIAVSVCLFNVRDTFDCEIDQNFPFCLDWKQFKLTLIHLWEIYRSSWDGF